MKNFLLILTVLTMSSSLIIANNGSIAGAEYLAINTSTTVSNANGSVNNEGEPDCATSSVPEKYDVFYQFSEYETNGNDFQVEITVNNVTSGFNMWTEIFDENLNSLGCFFSNEFVDAFVIMSFQSGVVYYFRIYDDSRVNGNTIGSADFTIESDASFSVQPITLRDFSGSSLGNTVNLSWVTESELNSDYLEVQYSNNQYNWLNIGKVATHTNSSKLQHYQFDYSFLDHELRSKLYFRLVNHDIDGRTQTFGPITVYFEEFEDVFFAHNGSLYVTSLSHDKQPKAIIYTSAGQRITTVDLQLGANQFGAHLLQGMYFVQIVDAMNMLPLSETKRMIIP